MELKVKRNIVYNKRSVTTRWRGEKMRPESVAMIGVDAATWNRNLYFNECAKLARKKTVKYLLKRIVRVMYR
jgi:hypothetical protein